MEELIMCTPPLNPFLNVPRPRPPESTWALMTSSSAVVMYVRGCGLVLIHSFTFEICGDIAHVTFNGKVESHS